MKNKKLLKFLGVILLLIFFCSYFIQLSGYYEYNLQGKKNLTEEQIKRFEEDVKSGKNVDIGEYLKENTVDYSNSLTRTTTDVSIKLNDYLKGFLTNGFKIFSKFFK